MICKEINCGFVATCPEMMEHHKKLFHLEPIIKSVMSNTEEQQSNKRKADFDLDNTKQLKVSSPGKKPRNIRINIENILSRKHVRESVIKTLIEDQSVGCDQCNVKMDNESKIFSDLTNCDTKGNTLLSVPKPSVQLNNSYGLAAGHRIVDMGLVSLALKNAQSCGHGTLILAENLSEDCKVDLATQLAFICSTCGNQTLFPTSSFCLSEPQNYTINKNLLTKIGRTAFISLIKEFNSPKEKIQPIKFRNWSKASIKPKMIASFTGHQKGEVKKIHLPMREKSEKSIYSSENNKHLNTTNIGGTPSENQEPKVESTFSVLDKKEEVIAEDNGGQAEEDVIDVSKYLNIKLDHDESDIIEDHVEVDPLAQNNINETIGSNPDEYEQNSNDSIDQLLEDDPQLNDSLEPTPKIKIRNFQDLQKQAKDKSEETENQNIHSWTIAEDPPSESATSIEALGGLATPIPPGTKVVSSNVIKTTESESGLKPGVYRFIKHGSSNKEAILVVKASPVISNIRTEKDKEKQSDKEEEGKNSSKSKSAKDDYSPMYHDLCHDESSKYVTAFQLFKKEMESIMYNSDIKFIRERWISLSDNEKKQYGEMATQHNLEVRRNVSEDLSSLPCKVALPREWKCSVVQTDSDGITRLKISSPGGEDIFDREHLKEYILQKNIPTVDPYSIHFTKEHELQATLSKKEVVELFSTVRNQVNLPTYKLPIDLNKDLIKMNASSIIVSNNVEYILRKLFGPDGSELEMYVPLIQELTSRYIIEIPEGYRKLCPRTFWRLKKNEVYRAFTKRKAFGPDGKWTHVFVKVIKNHEGEKSICVPKGHKIPLPQATYK